MNIDTVSEEVVYAEIGENRRSGDLFSSQVSGTVRREVRLGLGRPQPQAKVSSHLARLRAFLSNRIGIPRRSRAVTES